MRKRSDETIIKRLMNVSWNGNKKNPALYCYSTLTVGNETYKAFQNSLYVLADKEQSFGYFETKDVNLNKFFSDFVNYSHKFVNLTDITIASVKEQIKQRKELNKVYGKQPAYYVFDDGEGLAYNPEFMLDCLEFVGDCSVYVYAYGDAFTSKGAYKKPIFFSSSDGQRIGLLMPVNADFSNMTRQTA